MALQSVLFRHCIKTQGIWRYPFSLRDLLVPQIEWDLPDAAPYQAGGHVFHSIESSHMMSHVAMWKSSHLPKAGLERRPFDSGIALVGPDWRRSINSGLDRSKVHSHHDPGILNSGEHHLLKAMDSGAIVELHASYDLWRSVHGAYYPVRFGLTVPPTLMDPLLKGETPIGLANAYGNRAAHCCSLYRTKSGKYSRLALSTEAKSAMDSK